MKIKLGILALVLATTVSADTIFGLYAGAKYWNYGINGNIQSGISQNENVDVDYSKANGNILYVNVEHAVPFLPNIGLKQTNIDTSDVISLSNATSAPGQTIDVFAKTDLSHTDFTLYYEVLDNWINLDLGVTVKLFDGYNDFYSEGFIDEHSAFDEWIPMLYGKGEFDLPFTGFSTSIQLNALSFRNSKVTDFEAALSYESKLGFGADLGYKSLDLDLPDIEDYKSDLTVDGFFLGVSYHF